jgi:hypothetical protein
VKFYKRVLKQGTRGSREYYKPARAKNTGNAAKNAISRAAAEVDPGRYKTVNRSKTTGLLKIRPGFALGEYNLQKRTKPAVNFGDNLRENDIANTNNYTLVRWITMITGKLRNTPSLTNETLNKYRIILKGAGNSRNVPVSGTTPEKNRKKRLEIVNLAKIATAALNKYKETRRPAGTAKGQKRSAPMRSSARASSAPIRSYNN